MKVKVKIQPRNGEGRVHPVVFLSTRLNKYDPPPPPARGRHSARKSTAHCCKYTVLFTISKIFSRRAPLPLLEECKLQPGGS